MPRFVALPASMTKIQKLSCSAGQWYLALCLSITRLVMVDCEEAILRRVEQYRGDWRFQGKAQLRRGNSSSACCSPSSLSSVRAAPYGCSCNLCPLSRRSSVKLSHCVNATVAESWQAQQQMSSVNQSAQSTSASTSVRQLNVLSPRVRRYRDRNSGEIEDVSGRVRWWRKPLRCSEVFSVARRKEGDEEMNE